MIENNIYDDDKDVNIIDNMNTIDIEAAPNGIPLDYKRLNEQIHQAIKNGYHKIIINNVCGQRFIGASLQGEFEITINGLPGNDLGIFMDGPKIIVNGNCEDQAGNTMNNGFLIIHGGAGDVIGMSARGGKIYVKKDVGYRVGIHIKEYEQQFPIIIVGGIARDFLGEYMAGGMIVVLGLNFLRDGTLSDSDRSVCGTELGTGIHRGKILLRTNENLESKLGIGARIFEITEEERTQLEPYLKEFCEFFGIPQKIISNKPFKVIKPISKRPFGGNYCGQLI